MKITPFFRFLTLACLLAAVPAARADYKQAVAFYNQGQFAKAIQELKPDLDRSPEWEFGHRLLGLCYLNLGNNALAVSSFARAAELQSTAFATYYGLGQAHFNMRRYADSVTALGRAETLAAREKNPEAEKTKVYKLRGAAHYRLKRFDAAAADLERALRNGSGDWTDRSMLGVSYLNTNRTDEAIAELERALAQKPGEPTVREAMGKAYFQKGVAALRRKEYAAAAQALGKAREYDSRNGYLHYNLAEAYLFQNRYAEAERALGEAVRLLPENPGVHARLGLVYEKQKKWDPALEAYRKADSLSGSKELKEAIERVTENKK
ncbi:MAG: tetratricopeptide repeat protein [Acidobacteria bacterium]|nr:tetratricopeptide repeat protein [Acidobacteriota bacterium]